MGTAYKVDVSNNKDIGTGAIKEGEMEEERFIFEFIKPFKSKVPWNIWHLVVGGWEVSGKNKEDLEKEAIRLLERELKRLKK